MWQKILQQINPSLPAPFELAQKEQLGANDVCQMYLLTPRNGAQPLFVKVSHIERLEQLENEAFNLQHLARSQSVRVPKALASGAFRDQAYLAMEYMPNLTTETADQHWYQLGQQLAQMHRSGESGMYGWDQDNFIGSTSQPNSWQKKWCTFFAEQRIGWQLQLAEENGMHFAPIEQLVEHIYLALRDHQPEPALLHGDLWHGNLGFSNQQPVIYDPACYFGDRETDLAMTELFTALPQAFYDGYHATWPLPEGYLHRKTLYNLYHLLNHANLFGGRYISQCEQAIQALLR